MYVPHERRALILRLLEQRGYIRSAALAVELGVTEETIRTDLIALHERQLLRRVHGGARFIPPTGGAEDTTRLDCQFIDLIMPHITPGLTLYLDASPLAHALLPRLAECSCTIITPSPRLLMAISAPALALQGIIPGGRLDKESKLICCGSGAADYLREHGLQLALLCPPALPTPHQAAYRHATRAAWAAAATQAAERTIITAPAQVFYTTAPHSIPCTPDLLIAEDNLPPAFDHLPTHLVPYLSPADLQREDELL